VFNSCSDDDDEKETSLGIVGKWAYDGPGDIDVKTNSSTNDKIISNFFTSLVKEDFEDAIIEFKSNGTVNVTEDGEVISSKYTYVNNVLTVTDTEGYVSTYKDVLNVNSLFLTFDYADEFSKELNELDFLLYLGISDPFEFEIEKGIAQIKFKRL